MSWFQLGPKEIADRTRGTGVVNQIPTAGEAIGRGIAGFTLLSVAGFAPWALGGRILYRLVGETGMYCACALVFIGLSGPLLHRLIIGPGSLARFYKLFALTFAANSVLWMAGWMTLHGYIGSVVGLLAGTAAMGWMLARAFDEPKALGKAILALFILNAIGYFGGGLIEGAMMASGDFSILSWTVEKKIRILTGQLLWGACYGAGFGAGLGLALYECQRTARSLLAEVRRPS